MRNKEVHHCIIMVGMAPVLVQWALLVQIFSPVLRISLDLGHTHEMGETMM
jgi:hypothetical protein